MRERERERERESFEKKAHYIIHLLNTNSVTRKKVEKIFITDSPFSEKNF